MVSCNATHSAQHTALRFRIVRGGHVLATARTLVSHKGTAKAALRSRRSLRAGRYTLRIAVADPTGVSALHRSVTLG